MEGDQFSADQLDFIFVSSLKFLSWRELLNVSSVSSRWKDIICAEKDSELWKKLDLRFENNPGGTLQKLLTFPFVQQSLHSVTLEFCEVSNSHLVNLPRCLKDLNLNGCREVEDEGLYHVAERCNELRSIGFYWNTRITDGGVTVLAECNGPTLEHVNFSGCTNLSDSSLKYIINKSPLITYLNCTRCEQITDKGAILAVTKLPKLTHLYFYACAQLTNSFLLSIPSPSLLQSLDLCGCRMIDDAGVTALAKACPSLKFLNLTWVVMLTDASLFALAASCHQLETLSLHGIVGLTDAGLNALARSPCASSLKALDVFGCNHILRKTKEDLRALFPNLHTFKIHS